MELLRRMFWPVGHRPRWPWEVWRWMKANFGGTYALVTLIDDADALVARSREMATTLESLHDPRGARLAREFCAGGLMKLGEYEASAAEAVHALEDPRLRCTSGGWAWLAGMQVSGGRFEQTLRFAERAIDTVEPGDSPVVEAWARALCASALTSLNRPLHASQQAGRAMALLEREPEPVAPELHEAILLVFTTTLEIEGAHAHALRVLEPFSSASAEHVRARCLLALDRVDEAIAAFERAVELGVPGAAVGVARATCQAGRAQASVRWAERALASELDGGDRLAARFFRTQGYFDLGQLEQVLSVSEAPDPCEGGTAEQSPGQSLDVRMSEVLLRPEPVLRDRRDSLGELAILELRVLAAEGLSRTDIEVDARRRLAMGVQQARARGEQDDRLDRWEALLDAGRSG